MTDTPHRHSSPHAAVRLPAVEAQAPRPFWSVIIPIYNRTTYLPHCLAAVLEQAPSAEEMEIIVHDDCSPEDLSRFVETLGRGRVRYERTTERRGLYPNINQALRKTRGRWIHICNDDDFVLPGFYDTMRRAIEIQPAEVGLAFCQFTSLDENHNTEYTPEPFREGPGPIHRWLEILTLNNPLIIPAVVYRRDVFEQIGMYREDLPYAGEWEFYIRAAARFVFWHQPENLARYRYHASNWTWELKASGKAAEDMRRTLELAERLLPADLAPRILRQARQYQCERNCSEAMIAIEAGNVPMAVNILRQSLLLGPDVRGVPELYQLLSHPAIIAQQVDLPPWLRSA